MVKEDITKGFVDDQLEQKVNWRTYKVEHNKKSGKVDLTWTASVDMRDIIQAMFKELEDCEGY